MIKEKIREWLGLDEIRQDIQGIANTQYNHKMISDAALKELRMLTPGLGRIIAKIDPAYVADPHSSSTKAASDEIGDLAIRRLKGEHEARNKWDPK